MTKEDLLILIDEYIKANGAQEITGAILNSLFKQVVSIIPLDLVYQKALIKTDAAPTAPGLYGLSETGIYTNLGGINALAGKLNFASFDGTTWSLIAVDMPNDAVDNLTSTSTTSKLSANMGRVLDGKISDNTKSINFINDTLEWNKIFTPVFNYTIDATKEFNFINAKIPQGKTLKLYVKAQYTGNFTLYVKKDEQPATMIFNISNTDFSLGKTFDFTIPNGDYNKLKFIIGQSGILFNEVSILDLFSKQSAMPTEVKEISENFSWNKFLTPLLNYTPNISTNFSPTYFDYNNIPKGVALKIYIKAQYTGKFTLYSKKEGTSNVSILVDVIDTDFSLGKTFDFIIPNGDHDNISYHTHQAGVLINEISLLKNEISSASIPEKKLTGLKWTSFGDSVTDYKQWQKRVENITGISTYIRACGSTAITFSIGQMAVRPDGETIDRRNIYASDQAFIAAVNAKGFTNQITSVSWTDYSANPTAYPTIGSDTTAYFLIDTKANSTDRVNTIPLDSDIVSIMFYNDFQTWTDTTIGSIYDYTIDTGINYGRGTYIANLRQMITKIKARVPKAKIIIMIPYQNIFNKYDLATNTLTAEGIGNEKMRDALRSVARTYGFTIIDLTKVINYYTAVYYLADTIHPNYDGQYQIGNFVADEFIKMKEFLIKKIN